MNKHPHNHAFHAARLVLLVAGRLGAALLLPSAAVPESRVATGAPSASAAAAAHVDFKIVIPKVLSMQVGNMRDGVLGAQTVAVMSNSHNVTLNATTRDSNDPARGNVILSAAARKGIAQDAQCTLGLVRAAPPLPRGAGDIGSRAMICTVSMP